MPTITLKLPAPLHQQLEATAHRLGRNKSEVVREALQVFLGTSGVQESAALYMVEDLMGCVEGPEDLSTNPDHLEGLGRDAGDS